MQADIDNKRTDTIYKVTLTRLEPWKTIVAVMAAVAVVVGLVAGLVGYKIGSTPPAPIILQQIPPSAR
jgi:anti-sigma-K factor RskA